MGSLVISASDAMMCIISLAALVILGYVIQKTRLGRALRAVSFDRDTAQLMGIDFDPDHPAHICHLRLVGRCGRRVPGHQIYIVSHAGKLVVKGFIASVIGGLGSLTGAIIGAVLLGLTETILLSMLGSGYSTIATFAIMLVFLLVRPQGIAGSNIQEKA